MITPTYEWQFAPQVEDADFTKIAKKSGLGPEVARLLFERGIQDEESLKKFLEPSLEDLHDPYLLHDMDKAVERIRQAIEEGENILIYGDYDADGMTSASIVKEVWNNLVPSAVFTCLIVLLMDMVPMLVFINTLSSKREFP